MCTKWFIKHSKQPLGITPVAKTWALCTSLQEFPSTQTECTSWCLPKISIGFQVCSGAVALQTKKLLKTVKNGTVWPSQDVDFDSIVKPRCTVSHDLPQLPISRALFSSADIFSIAQARLKMIVFVR